MSTTASCAIPRWILRRRETCLCRCRLGLQVWRQAGGGRRIRSPLRRNRMSYSRCGSCFRTARRGRKGRSRTYVQLSGIPCLILIFRGQRKSVPILSSKPSLRSGAQGSCPRIDIYEISRSTACATKGIGRSKPIECS